MLLEKENVAETIVVKFKLKTRVETPNVRRFHQELMTFLKEADYRIILDCANLEFLDSSGFSVLVNCLKESIAHNGWIKLINLCLALQQIFDIIKLDKYFPSFNSSPSA